MFKYLIKIAEITYGNYKTLVEVSQSNVLEEKANIFSI